MADQEIKMVCFRLDDEEYGVDVADVLGVNHMLEITHVPEAPDFVEGVIRIREKIIPVIDLKKRFKLSKQSSMEKRGRMIVVKIRGVRVGLIVDGASNVVSIPTANIEPPSPVLNHAGYLKGVGRLEKKLILLLDLDKLLAPEELEGLAGVKHG